MVLSSLTLWLLVGAIIGGVAGALVGALPMLGLAGVVIVVGEMAGSGVLATNPPSVIDPAVAPLDAVGITGALGFGPVVGPHVAFAGGVAAAAYAGRKQTFDTTFRYHQAKQIAIPLPREPGVVLVGAGFGVVGITIATLAARLSVPVDPIAFSIVLSALFHRAAFGYPLLGRLRELDRSLLDMSPFTEGRYWGKTGDETAQGTGGRHIVEPWQPAYYEPRLVLGLGAGVGLGAGIVAVVADSPFLAFGIAAASLLAVSAEIYDVPVTHHIALPAGIVAVAVDGSPVAALAGAVVFGVAAAAIAELAQRVLYAHADTHFDPAFVAILITSVVLSALASAGLLDAGAVPYPVL